jgi:RNA polymerase primary sigma factor
MIEDSSLDRYLDEIGRENLLSSDEEARLSQRIKAGDKRALSKLVEANLRFVVKIASQYRGKGVDLEDLISEGNLGLMKAAAKFDASKGIRFVNFAVVYIRQKMEQAIDKTALYQVPKNIPSNHADRQNSHALSYDAPLGHRTNMSLLSVLVNPNAPIADERVYSEAMKQAIERALEGLDARESRVVNAFFAIDREHETMAEIAEDMGLKRERVRQIRDKAVRKLRKSFKAYLRSNNTTFST